MSDFPYRVLGITAFLLALGGLAAPRQFPQELRFKSFKLESTDPVDYILPVDLKGNGLQDLIVQVGKELRIFTQTREHGFKPVPDQSFRLPEDCFLWHTGHIAGAGKRLCLFALTSSGVVVYEPDKEGVFPQTPRELITTAHLLEGRAVKPPLYVDFVPELSADGRSDVILFQRNQLWLFRQDAQGEFSLAQKLKLETSLSTTISASANGTLNSTFALPFLAFYGVHGNGRKDIVVFKDGILHVFLQAPDGRFPATENESYSLEGRWKRRAFINVTIPPVLADFNGNGLMDIAVADAGKGKVYLYFGRKGQKDYPAPDDIKELDGWVTRLWFVDLQNRHKLDMLLPVIERLNLLSGIDALITKRLTLKLYVFPLRENGYDKSPAQTLSFVVPFVMRVTREFSASTSGANFALTFTPNFEGDFKGDGLKDLLIKSPDENALLVYYGNRQTGFEAQPQVLLRFHPPAGTSFTEATVADLNGDGRADIILRYVNWDEGKNTIEIFLSEK